jgi:hypothetical protein
MVRTLTTVVLECDHCDACYYDCHEITHDSLFECAERAGWFLIDGRNYCPACGGAAHAAWQAGFARTSGGQR